MRLFKSAEVKGIAGMVLVILVIGFALLIATGKLETWFGFTWGPRALDRIIYVSAASGTPRIYSIKTDGSGRKQLTGKGTQVLSAPAISPLGNRIAFISLVGKSSQVMVMGGEGGSPEQLTATETPKNAVAFSPDGCCISYIASGRVYVSGIGGDNPEVVLPTEEEEHEAMANPITRGELPPYRDYAWGPDSAKMAGVTKVADGSDLLVYLPKPGAEAMRFAGLALGQAQISGIAWGAKKPMLVATINVREGGAVVLFDAKAKNPKFVLFRDEFVGKPAVSPDGSVAVVPFQSMKNPKSQGLARLVTATGERGTMTSGLFANPSYSPKGDAILAIKLDVRKKARDLVIIDPSSGDVTQLTRDGKVMAGIWSPISDK